MRNGIYRIWYKGQDVHGSAAVILVDGAYISCNPEHTCLGEYTDTNGHFAAEVLCTRHSEAAPFPEKADLTEFHMIHKGHAAGESVTGRCTIREMPGFSMEVEYLWISDI